MSTQRQIGVALFCFAGKKGATRTRKRLETTLRSNGDEVLQTTILEVDKHHKASVHDPRRVVAGTLTAALTWGLFGLVSGTDRLESAIIWAVVGAICGGAYGYWCEHVLTKSELERIGRQMPGDSSALVTYVETSDATEDLAVSGTFAPSAASVAVIDGDLSARVFAGAAAPVETSDGASATAALDQASVLSMLLYRYPDPKTAGHVAAALAKGAKTNGTPRVELVIETDRRGRRRVSDPTHGTAAWARSDVISWGAFGVVFGAIVGATGGGGILGFLEGGVVTGIAWAIFGLAAGALYGLWAGRSVSARRLHGIGPILAPGTSALLAWTNGSLGEHVLDELARPQAQHLVLSFDPVPGGAVLETEGGSW
jgi:uncharacterized membrane protein